MGRVLRAVKATADDLKQGGMIVALGYMMYVAWDSMERDRYLTAYQGAGEIPILWSPAFLTVALLCALVAFLAYKGVLRTLYVKPLRIAVPLVGSVSSIVLCLQRLAGETPNPCLIATFGLSIAWFILVWAERFGSIGGWRTFSIVLVADALSAILQYFCVQSMGSAALLITTALLPLLAAALLRFAPYREGEQELEKKSSSFAWTWVLALAVAAFGIMYFMLRSVMYMHPLTFINAAVVPAGSLCALLVLFVLAVFLPHGERFARLFIPGSIAIATLIFVFAMVLTPFLHADAVWSVLVVMGNRFGFVALIVGLAELAHRQNVLPLSVYGVGFAALYAGYAVGGFVGVYLARYAESVTGLLIGCSILSLMCIGLSFAWIFRERAGDASDSDGERSAGGDRAEPASFDGYFDAAIAQVREEFELSPREAEVLSLMARGRTGPYISETLFISQNTTKKHVQHIYRKLDIHSNQEAIDLVEARCRLLSAAFCK
ncbi:response regulator transcription factor [Raoultibacter massiliensis]|uniref:helix-turn-helix transcriptional regulator n=1 Tax=Raoultibacter massiliensis TaxID=1852371 RepID=UPI003A92F1A9